MKDLLPSDSPVWQYLEKTISSLLQSYGYKEIRFPILENTELFARGIGDGTDIVEKEMYTFEDRNGDSLTLRPEGTASCVRACEEHQLIYNRGNLVQKLWYSGPMFRHEKPQKGRLRQFHQIGVEAYGLKGPDIDIELLLLTARLWKKLGITPYVSLQINSLGTKESRAQHKADLLAYLNERKGQLDEDSLRRLDKNPLRILDSKVSATQALVADAPSLIDYLDEESSTHFEKIKRTLNECGIHFEVNPRLVRGLDYYSQTVFEWVTDKLGAQGTVCAGGRYDSLIEELGGKPTHAIGFAMGIERLVLLLEELKLVPAEIYNTLDVYCLVIGDLQQEAIALVEHIRDTLPALRIQLHCGGGGFKNQIKKADKSGARLALILGEDEALNEQITLKYLREDKDQITIKQSELSRFLAEE